MRRTIDRRRRERRRNPVQTRRAEAQYRGSLTQVARQVGALINGFAPVDDPMQLPTITDLLRRYADALTDWARAVASRMLSEVEKRDRAAWESHADEMSQALRAEIQSAPTGERMRQLLDEQVTLIRSIPLDAAKRVHELTLKAQEDSTRAREVAAEIRRSTQVSESKANLIARTEVARTASVLTQARAEHIGSTHYVWRTSGDTDVRDSHKQMDGKVCAWAEPPLLSDGTRTHPGQIYNCRCYPEPIIPKD